METICPHDYVSGGSPDCELEVVRENSQLVEPSKCHRNKLIPTSLSVA